LVKADIFILGRQAEVALISTQDRHPAPGSDTTRSSLMGGQVIFTLLRIGVLCSMVMNHMIHHCLLPVQWRARARNIRALGGRSMRAVLLESQSRPVNAGLL